MSKDKSKEKAKEPSSPAKPKSAGPAAPVPSKVKAPSKPAAPAAPVAKSAPAAAAPAPAAASPRPRPTDFDDEGGSVRRDPKSKVKIVAILVENRFEDLEVWYPYFRFQESGCQVTLIGSSQRQVYDGMHGTQIKVDRQVENVNPKDFDALIVPGGWAAYSLRVVDPVLELVRGMDASARCVSAISQGAWVLCSSGVLRGRLATGKRELRDDMKNAGCRWSDDEVAVDKNLITAKLTRNLPNFCKAVHAALGIQSL